MFGVKPFYFHRSSAGFACGSSVDAVLAMPGVSRGLDPLGMADWLMAFHEDRARTMYSDVHRLPPGHSLAVEGGGSRTRTYWRPDRLEELRLRSDAEYDEAFRTVLTQAVKSRLPPGGRLGSTLSGGLDSSAVTAVAQRLRGEAPLEAFNVVFETEPRSDERHYAGAVLVHIRAIGHECPADGFSPLADWEGAPWRGVDPDGNAQNVLARAYQMGARREGIDVLLTGFGGDEVVSHGLAYLTELAASARLRHLLSETRTLAGRSGKSLPALLRPALSPLLPAGLVTAVRTMRGHIPHWPHEIPVRPEIVRGLDLRNRIGDIVGDPRQPRTQREAHVQLLTGGSVPFGMESRYRADRTTGIERRYPFHDRRLAELCLSLPPNQRLRDGWTRLILRRSMAGIVPEEVCWRRGKGNLGHAFTAGLHTTDRPVLERVVADPGPIRQWVDPRYVADLYRRCLEHGSQQDWYTMWRVAVMALWLREHQLEPPAVGG